jgi:hypothetical protein
VSISAAEAEDVLRQVMGELPEGDHVVAQAVADSELWTVQAFDAEGRPYAGTVMFVGPDRRLWTLSSNPAIHDTRLGARLLEAAYRENLTDRLDEALFSERVQQITTARLDAERDFMTDLVGGSLRSPQRRTLP